MQPRFRFSFPLMRRQSALWLVMLAGLLTLCTASAENRSPHANYILRCAGCHALDGSGSSLGGVPPLSLIKTFTSDSAGRTYIMHVPGVVNSGLTDQEIADVLNYVVYKWGGSELPFTSFSVEEVSRLRAIDVPDIVSYRRDLTRSYIEAGKRVADYPWP